MSGLESRRQRLRLTDGSASKQYRYSRGKPRASRPCRCVSNLSTESSVRGPDRKCHQIFRVSRLAGFKRRTRRTARPVVWEAHRAQSPSRPDHGRADVIRDSVRVVVLDPSTNLSDRLIYKTDGLDAMTALVARASRQRPLGFTECPQRVLHVRLRLFMPNLGHSERRKKRRESACRKPAPNDSSHGNTPLPLSVARVFLYYDFYR